MKIHIGKEFPPHFREAYPGEFELFHHFETTAGIPNVLFAVTTWKENGQPNVCFHGWSCFHGDKTAFFAVMGNLYQHTHTFQNIQREGCFCVNFLPMGRYESLVETIHQNGLETDEFAAGGFTPVPAHTIHAPAIEEAFLTLECTLHSVQRASPPWSSAKCSTPLWRRATPGATAAGTARRALCCWCPRPKTCSPGRRGSPALPRCALKNWIEPQAIGKYRKKESL